MAEKVDNLDVEREEEADVDIDPLEFAKLTECDTGRTKYEMEVCLGNEESDLKDRVMSCNKNPGHPNFFPVQQLTKDHLPPSLQHPLVWEMITMMTQKTVRLIVRGASPSRPTDYPFSGKMWRKVARYGTGYTNLGMSGLGEFKAFPCTMPNCDQPSDHKEYGIIYINTATHVVFDKFEADKTTVEFFFDDGDDRSGVKKARVVEAVNFETTLEILEDRTLLKCLTHDSSLIEKLQQLDGAFGKVESEWEKLKFSEKDESVSQFAVITSHPHGLSKHVSTGRLHDDTVKTDYGAPLYDASTCPGSSGAPVLHFNSSPELDLLQPSIYTHSGSGDDGYNVGSVCVYLEGSKATLVRESKLDV